MLKKNLAALALVAAIAPFPSTFPVAAEVPTPSKHELAEQACLVAAAWNEARGTPVPQITAVMHVVVNRTKHPSYEPTICGVVLERGQFQMTPSFRAAVQRARRTGHFEVAGLQGANARAMERIRAVAALVQNGHSVDPTGGATHFWSPALRQLMGYRRPPSWARRLPMTRSLGPFRFHRQII